MSDNPSEDVLGVRLQKAMASAGVASRRVCEQMISAGRVTVNGRVVTTLGTRVRPERDRIALDDVPVQLDSEKRYYLLNKPRGVVSTLRDEHGRPDLRQYTEALDERVFNVGRLDAETSGLLILTNDGELAHVLAHPSFGVTKTYVARVQGKVTNRELSKLRGGVVLSDGRTSVDAATILDAKGSESTLVRVSLHSGRNRIVRRLFDAIGHPVQDLVRREFGPLKLGRLRSGVVRELTPGEQGAILKIARASETSPQRDSQVASGPPTGRPESSKTRPRRSGKGQKH